jgi:hypothetical protein
MSESRKLGKGRFKKGQSAEYHALPKADRDRLVKTAKGNKKVTKSGLNPYGPRPSTTDKKFHAEQRAASIAAARVRAIARLKQETDDAIAWSKNPALRTGVDTFVAFARNLHNPWEDMQVAIAEIRERFAEDQVATAALYKDLLRGFSSDVLNSEDCKSIVSDAFSEAEENSLIAIPPQHPLALHLRWTGRGTRDRARKLADLKGNSTAGRALHNAVDCVFTGVHDSIRHADVPHLGLVPPTESHCFRQRRCTCGVDESREEFLLERFQGTAKGLFKSQADVAELKRSYIVVGFCGTRLDAVDVLIDGVGDAERPRMHWFHWATLVSSPYKFFLLHVDVGASVTFAEQRFQLKSVDRGPVDKWGLADVLCDDGGINLSWSTAFYRLEDDDRRLGSFRPMLQWARKILVCKGDEGVFQFWNGLPSEQALAKFLKL